jgi:DNA-directed RNA polymerase I, II, and III subunit RPABC2
MADEDNDIYAAGADAEDVLIDGAEFGDDEAADAAAATAAGERNHIMYHHPEAVIDYLETVNPKIPLQVAPPVDAADRDPHHTSLPFLTVYERTKILGTRANQIADGARAFVKVPEHVTEPLEIAKLELEQRRLPFIIKRPMPDGTFEYWRLSDLMIL